MIVCSNIWLLCLIVVFSPGGTASLWYQTFPFSEQSCPNLIWISLKNFCPEFGTSLVQIKIVSFGCNAQNFNKQVALRYMSTLKYVKFVKSFCSYNHFVNIISSCNFVTLLKRSKKHCTFERLPHCSDIYVTFWAEDEEG